jgi:hypothetical protein
MRAFGFAQVVSIVSEWVGRYLLLGIRSLFLRSVWAHRYIVNAARCGSYTRGCARDGSDHSIRFPAWLRVYFLFDFVGDDHLVAGLAPRYFGDGVLGLVGVVVIIASHY